MRTATSNLDLTPLTATLAVRSGMDRDLLLADFTRAIGYRDVGPDFWRAADEFLVFMSEHPKFSVFDREVVSLERVGVAIARRVGKRTDIWEQPLQSLEESDVKPTDRFVQRGTGSLFVSRHDLSPWLEDTEDSSLKTDSSDEPHHFLVYIAAPEELPEVAELPSHVADAFAKLERPRTCNELAIECGDLTHEDAIEIVVSLCELGVLNRVP